MSKAAYRRRIGGIFPRRIRCWPHYGIDDAFGDAANDVRNLTPILSLRDYLS